MVCLAETRFHFVCGWRAWPGVHSDVAGAAGPLADVGERIACRASFTREKV